MDAQTAIKNSLATAEMVAMSYLGDLTDEEFMKRPHPQCNHVNWQVGHLIASEHHMASQIPGAEMPALPEGFAEKYSKETATIDDAAKFESRENLLAVYKTQRAAALENLAKASAEELDAESGVDYAPTVGGLYSMLGAHWMMHCGQWVIVRRESGKPVVI